jgi:translation elongation factor EF-1beta
LIDDETDMEELKANVLAIEKDGLVWGASKLVAVGFGIKKLQINLVVEDEKVSLDELQQQIEEDEDHVQSTDIVSLHAVVSDFPHAYMYTGCYAEVVKNIALFFSSPLVDLPPVRLQLDHDFVWDGHGLRTSCVTS